MNTGRVVILVATALVAAWFFRFELVPSGNGGAYRLNRWTGAVDLLSPFGEVKRLSNASESKGAKPWEKDWSESK